MPTASDHPRRVHRVRTLAALCLLTAPALGGIPDYDFGWSVIGDPGNRAANREEAPGFWNSAGQPLITVGSVDHTYRMSTTEVTCTQYVEFLNAYRHHTNLPLNTVQLTGILIAYNPDTDAFAIRSGHEQAGVAVTWRMAARYTNWLHNGKGNEASDFEAGVYDTKTFSENPNGSFNDQLTHDPDAQFWLPTLDKWVKAAHWDPDKSNGEGGYWYYPNGSDEPPVYATPDAGGTSNGGIDRVFGVASYEAQGPWGLYDMSGGETEWTGSADASRSARLTKGSTFFSPPEYMDRLDGLGVGLPYIGYYGFRVASIVPAPATLLLPLAALLTSRRRRA